MFDDLENMLGGQVPGKPAQNSKFNAPSLKKKGSSSRIVPVDDLDDMDD